MTCHVTKYGEGFQGVSVCECGYSRPNNLTGFVCPTGGTDMTIRVVLDPIGEAIALRTALDATTARAEAMERERDELRKAIFGGDNYLSILSNGNFCEMAEVLHAAQKGGLARAEAAEAAAKTARAVALREASAVITTYLGYTRIGPAIEIAASEHTATYLRAVILALIDKEPRHD